MVPASMAEFLNDQGNLLTAKAYIQRKAGLPANRAQKITDLIKSLGNKGKALKKAYNAARAIIAKAHGKAWALAGADPTMRKSVKFVYNAKGAFIGINGSARFVKQSADVDALIERNAALEARIAELEAVTAPA